MWALGSHRVCERERAMARALCMGRVGVWGAGLSSGAADLGDVLWGPLLPSDPLLYGLCASCCMSRPVKAPIPSCM